MNETINIEDNLGRDLAKKIHKMTKQELINFLCLTLMKSRVQAESLNYVEENLEKSVDLLELKNEQLQAKLNKAESYVEQGRYMITACMDRWYEYDA